MDLLFLFRIVTKTQFERQTVKLKCITLKGVVLFTTISINLINYYNEENYYLSRFITFTYN